MTCSSEATYRKRLLLGFAFSGATAAALFLLLSSKSLIWPMSALLAMVANVGFGASVVAMNAYLPLLARESEEAHSLQHETGLLPARQNRSNIDESSSAPLLSSGSTHDDEPTASSREAHAAAISRSTARISSHGIAIGYAAGITLLILALIPVTLLKGSTFSLRLAIGASGIWWALGSIPAAIWLPSEGEMRREQAASAHAGEWEDEDEVKLGVGQEVKQAWVKLGRTLHPKEVRELYNTFKYLAAWFLLSDGSSLSFTRLSTRLTQIDSGFTTITSTAILFGKTALGMPASRLVIVGVLTPTAGIAGALIWPRIQQAFGWSNLRVLMTLVGLASLIPVYGCLGFIPFFGQGRAKFGGLTTQEEMFGLAVYFGAVYGAFQSYARALYAELIPPGEEARWWISFLPLASGADRSLLQVRLVLDHGQGQLRGAVPRLTF
jgi:UMF1 family MFS transporter